MRGYFFFFFHLKMLVLQLSDKYYTEVPILGFQTYSLEW